MNILDNSSPQIGDNRTYELDSFFNHYSATFNRSIRDQPDLKRTSEMFSSCFIAANPHGVSCGQNDEAFLDAMKSGYVFYKNIGITSMDILSKEITILDVYHAMVRIRWQCNFVKKDGDKDSLEFENIYFIQTLKSVHKVFAYITGDEQAVLKEAGLV